MHFVRHSVRGCPSLSSSSAYRQLLPVVLLSMVFVALPPYLSATFGNPGEITNIHVENVSQTTADVVWTTLHPSTSQVIIARDQNYAPARWAPLVADHNLVTEHRVKVDRLIPYNPRTGDGIYYYYVASVDVNGVLSTNPGPYDVMHGNSPPWMMLQTLPTATQLPIDYTIYAYGATNVYAGSDLYIQVQSILRAGPIGHLYIVDEGRFVAFSSVGASSLPTLSAHFMCSMYNPTGDDSKDQLVGKPYHFCWNENNSVSQQNLRIRTGLTTAPGRYSVTFKLSPDGTLARASSYTYVFDVLPRPAFRPTPPNRFPPIPNKAIWESQMTLLGAKWCDSTNGGSRDNLNAAGNFLTGFGWQQDTWFYDGGRVYQQIDDYTAANGNANHARWQHCALTILDPYRQYLIANKGAMAGYSIFPYGMLMNYFRTADTSNRDAINLLATKNGWASYGGLVDPYLVRETAYMVDVWVAAEMMGSARHPLAGHAVDRLIGIMDQFAFQKAEMHPFMAGLAMEALINWYEMNLQEGTPDNRVPLVVKNILDALWRDYWDPATSSLVYNRHDVPASVGLTMLNSLVAPGYAWYWSKTGNDTYLQHGDLLFSHTFDDLSQCNWDGKEFSQIYKWSFDYVRWRSGMPGSTVAKENNPLRGPYLDTEPPIEWNDKVSNVTATTATITWNTYEKADSQVQYGVGKGYYPSVTPVADSGPDMVTTHSVTLTGLKPVTAYHFRIRSTDAAGNVASLAERSFTTSGTGIFGSGSGATAGAPVSNSMSASKGAAH